LGNNFFVEINSVGKPRAEVTAHLLQELNGFVDLGNVILQDPAVLVSTTPDFVRDYDIIVANNLPNPIVTKLSESCVKWNKTLVTLRTNGMLGIIRLYRSEHRVLEKNQMPLNGIFVSKNHGQN